MLHVLAPTDLQCEPHTGVVGILPSLLGHNCIILSPPCLRGCQDLRGKKPVLCSNKAEMHLGCLQKCTAGPRCQKGPGFAVLQIPGMSAHSQTRLCRGRRMHPSALRCESSEEQGSVVLPSFWVSDLGQAAVAAPAMSPVSEPPEAGGGRSRDAHPRKESGNASQAPGNGLLKQVEGPPSHRAMTRQNRGWRFLNSQ